MYNPFALFRRNKDIDTTAIAPVLESAIAMQQRLMAFDIKNSYGPSLNLFRTSKGLWRQ